MLSSSQRRADKVIDSLLALIEDSDWWMQVAVVEALGRIPPGDRAGIVADRLVALLGAPNTPLKGAAAKALGQIPIPTGDRVSNVIDKLLPLHNDSGDVGGPAADTLARLLASDRENRVIEKLLSLLVSPNPELQSAAADTLSQIPAGDRAGMVIDEVLLLLSNSDPQVRRVAADMLARIPGAQGGSKGPREDPAR